MKVPRCRSQLLALIVGFALLLAYFLKKAGEPPFAIAGFVRGPGEPREAKPLAGASATAISVRPGDELLLRVSAPHAGYLTVAGIGGRTGREIALYYPKAVKAAPIAAGRQVDLPGIVADGRVGPELVYALLCGKPIRTDDVLAQLAQPKSASTHLWPSGGINLPCEIAVLGFFKCDVGECPQEAATAAQPAVAADGAPPGR